MSRWSSRVCKLTVAVDEFASNSTLVGIAGGGSQKSPRVKPLGSSTLICTVRGDAVSPVRVKVNVAASPSATLVESLAILMRGTSAGGSSMVNSASFWASSA